MKVRSSIRKQTVKRKYRQIKFNIKPMHVYLLIQAFLELLICVRLGGAKSNIYNQKTLQK